MTRNIYALFVGIDDYAGGVNPLKGCVNDVTRLYDLLAARIDSGSDRFDPLLLANGQATRQGIIDAWRRHLGQAGPGDVALFCYAGHGSQEHAPPEFWEFEPDLMNETLVCHDSRAAGGWDLADKELAQLISEVAANGPHFAVILDCCHSGSGTREADVTVRQAIADKRTRPIASYIVTPQQAAGMQGQQAGAAAPAMPWAAIASGRHILLAACRPEQTAKETVFPGPDGAERRGAFSYYLQDTLQQSGAALSYRDLFKRVNALVQQRITDQHPQLEASEPADLEQPFLGGAIPSAPAAFSLRRDKHLGWVIDAGAVHGIPQSAADGQSTQLVFFPFDADPASLRSLKQAAGQASVTKVYPGESAVTPARFDGAPLDIKTTYKAVVTSTPLPPLLVAFEGNRDALDLVRQALAGMNGPGAPSLLVRESDLASAEYRLLADIELGSYRIRRATDAGYLALDTPGLDLESAVVVVQRLEHIARWVSAARLTNPATQLPRDAVRLDIFSVDQNGERALEPLDTSSGVRYEYQQVAGGWRYPRVQIRLRNTMDRRLFCMLLGLNEDYSIYTGLLPRGGVWLEAGEEAWATMPSSAPLQETIIKVRIPNKQFEQYLAAAEARGELPVSMESSDILKLIVSTDEADATLMKQDDLPVEYVTSLRAIPRTPNTLSRLMARVHTRSYDAEADSDEAYVDWTTVEVASTIMRPVEAAVVV